MHPNEIINPDHYPSITRGHPAAEALRRRCRADLARAQYCIIPEFIAQDALNQMRAEALTLLPAAHHNNALRNCYLHRQVDRALLKAHPRNLQDRASTRMIAYDQLALTSPLRRFYLSQAVRELVTDIVGENELFASADPYQPANYVCYQQGDESAWHFDEDNAFTMTLMIQPSLSGGEFEIATHTRSADDENYAHVARILGGECQAQVQSVGRDPGDLCIFRGCHSLHRVTKVDGDQTRIMGVFVYESSPDKVGDPKVNATIYGPRTQQQDS